MPGTGTGTGGVPQSVKTWSWAALKNAHWVVIAIGVPVFYMFGVPAIEAGTLSLLERARIKSAIQEISDARFGKQVEEKLKPLKKKIDPLEGKIQHQTERIGEQNNLQIIQNQRLKHLEKSQEDSRVELRTFRTEQNQRLDKLFQALGGIRQ